MYILQQLIKSNIHFANGFFLFRMILGLWIVALVLPFVFGSSLRIAEDTAGISIQNGRNFEHVSKQDVDKKGKIWAVLVAGSYQYYDYRHQVSYYIFYLWHNERGCIFDFSIRVEWTFSSLAIFKFLKVVSDTFCTWINLYLLCLSLRALQIKTQ